MCSRIVAGFKKIYYKGTANDWKAIYWCGWNDVKATVYYKETKPKGPGNYWHYDTNGNVVEW